MMSSTMDVSGDRRRCELSEISTTRMALFAFFTGFPLRKTSVESGRPHNVTRVRDAALHLSLPWEACLYPTRIAVCGMLPPMPSQVGRQKLPVDRRKFACWSARSATLKPQSVPESRKAAKSSNWVRLPYTLPPMKQRFSKVKPSKAN